MLARSGAVAVLLFVGLACRSGGQSSGDADMHVGGDGGMDGGPVRHVETRTLTEFPAPSPGMLALGPDGNVWFTTGMKVGRITPAGDVATFDTVYGAQVTAIAAGVDGRIWYVNSDDHIGVLSVDGTGAVFTGIPTPVSGAISITAGPDGAMWFSEINQRVIGRVTLAWEFQEFPPGDEVGGVRSITAGPDGNLWFSTNYSTIGRITVAGAVTSFSVPRPPNASQLVYTFGITAGPDGNIWFTAMSSANDGAAIGRVTPAGVVTLFPLPDAACWPWEIAAGPDGNLWFTERNADFIGRITPAGAITEFATPPGGSDMEGIVAGGDGKIWFAERTAGKIATLTP